MWCMIEQNPESAQFKGKKEEQNIDRIQAKICNTE